MPGPRPRNMVGREAVIDGLARRAGGDSDAREIACRIIAVLRQEKAIDEDRIDELAREWARDG